MNDKSSLTPRATPDEIAGILRDRIKEGALRTGDRLPTQAALAEQFGVERGTVRHALQRLQADGLLTNVSKGSPPQVAPAPDTRGAGGSRAARSILGPRLVAAFGEPQVRVDVACLTAETLMTALGEPLRRVYEGADRPESVHLRVLLPLLDQDFDYPSPDKGWGHDEQLDAAVKERSRSQRAAQQTVLTNTVAGLRRSGIDARVDFGYTLGTPTRKAYLLNRRVALVGHYIPGRFLREIEDYEGTNPVPLCDVEGFDTPMFVFDAEGEGEQGAFVRAEQTMFDAVWDHVARSQA
ncbi:GntR family transcriptional regulator [Streptomyces kunmingensis]|uniref:GntR family transcriptional regulator n=1 Tax=Streptomyces kunmingensis TaxID=68225 RepID=A0ABU6C6E1_9ACTN|nr:GntR family transcriptional regulator [Streptomyces kunmingensis]MEB3960064.1 GntR family transcriptional regulator [Streptomyces kunmingensis]